MRCPTIVVAMVMTCTALSSCALWQPFDRDDYVGHADAKLIVERQQYRVSWDVPIHRTSGFNPYSPTGRSDGWSYKWGGASVQMADGTLLWIDLSRVMPPSSQIFSSMRLLGIGPAVPKNSADLLIPEHSIVVDAPVYFSKPAQAAVPLVPYSGHCGGVEMKVGCWAVVRISVPSSYKGPYDRNRYSYLVEPNATTTRCSDRDFLSHAAGTCAPPDDPLHHEICSPPVSGEECHKE